jgi:hypothetical protein
MRYAASYRQWYLACGSKVDPVSCVCGFALASAKPHTKKMVFRSAEGQNGFSSPTA